MDTLHDHADTSTDDAGEHHRAIEHAVARAAGVVRRKLMPYGTDEIGIAIAHAIVASWNVSVLSDFLAAVDRS